MTNEQERGFTLVCMVAGIIILSAYIFLSDIPIKHPIESTEGVITLNDDCKITEVK